MKILHTRENSTSKLSATCKLSHAYNKGFSYILFLFVLQFHSENTNSKLEKSYSMETEVSKLIRKSDTAVIKIKTTIPHVF